MSQMPQESIYGSGSGNSCLQKIKCDCTGEIKDENKKEYKC